VTTKNDKTGQAVPADELRHAIREAHHRWDHRAVEQEHSVLKVGYIIAILTPVAVLLLSIQTVFFNESSQRFIAIALIAAEVLILAVALFSLFANLLPSSHAWAGSRLRAELLRREEHLLLMRLGPYLDKTDRAALEAAVQSRLVLLGSEAVPPADLLAPPGADWRDQLEDVPLEQQALPSQAVLHDYLEQRVQHQQGWFQKKSQALARKHIFFERLAKAILILALVTAAMHLAALIHAVSGEHSFMERLVMILAIVLPPLGAGASALESFLQCQRLSYSYRDHAQVLKSMGTEITTLLQQMAEQDESTPHGRKLWKQAKRLALRCEELLTRELRQWYFVIRPEKPPVH
jgi:hypothetical protein